MRPADTRLQRRFIINSRGLTPLGLHHLRHKHMGLFDTLLGTLVDVVTIPLDVVADVSDVLSGEEPVSLANKARALGNDLGQGIEDFTNLDL